ncbi:MAG TPA: SAM-dependent methyltransferase, partial [Acidothermaceae bacterium]
AVRSLRGRAARQAFRQVAGRCRSGSLINVEPIGWVRSSRAGAIDDDWDAVTATIGLDAAQFTPDAVAGLEAFSHIEVVFVFDQVEIADVESGARHPRGNVEWPRVGIFAQRAKMRPNRVGVTVCRLLEVDGLVLRMAGLDAIDGTPVLDIKPYMREFGARGEVRQPQWSHELMAGYWTNPDRRI